MQSCDWIKSFRKFLASFQCLWREKNVHIFTHRRELFKMKSGVIARYLNHLRIGFATFSSFVSEVSRFKFTDEKLFEINRIGGKISIGNRFVAKKVFNRLCWKAAKIEFRRIYYYYYYFEFVSSKLTWSVSSAKMNNIVLPQIVPFDFGNEEINAMDMISASCTVNKGDLPIKITWTRNNQSIYSNDGVSISRTNQRISILSIESVRDRHSGTYMCIAENSAGSVNYTTSLWVNGTYSFNGATKCSIFKSMELCSCCIFIWFDLIWFSFILLCWS